MINLPVYELNTINIIQTEGTYNKTNIQKSRGKLKETGKKGAVHRNLSNRWKISKIKEMILKEKIWQA